ncbi:MAG: nucleoside deaminase [Leptospirales bacterium]
MYKTLHFNYQNKKHEAAPPYLAPPVDGKGEIYEFKIVSVNSNSADYHQKWDEYVPDCTLTNQDDCKYYPVQTANIKVEEIYKEIQIMGDQWMHLACEEAKKSIAKEGGPFGAVILQIDDETNEIIRYWTNHNQVTKINDPTAHAEVMTIRSACHSLGVFNLGNIEKGASNLPQPGEKSHCIIYSSAEPCPMCFSSISWANVRKMFFAATRFDAAVQGVNFSDEELYEELAKPYYARTMHVFQCTTDNSLSAFNKWKRVNKTNY